MDHFEAFIWKLGKNARKSLEKKIYLKTGSCDLKYCYAIESEYNLQYLEILKFEGNQMTKKK